MKIVLVIVAVIVALVLIVFAIGASMTKRHTASRTAFINRSPHDVYAVVRDVAKSPEWRADVQRVEVLGDRMFREHAKYGVVTYEVVEDKPADTFVTRIADKDLGYSGSWTYRFKPEGAGTRVEITEDGEVSNPFFRFMSRFVFSHTATMEKYLAALAIRCGTAPLPNEAPTQAR